MVGAYQDDTGASDSGSAYIFDVATGNLLRTLNNPTPAARDAFGCSVAVSGTMVAVGAYGDDTLGTNVGSVYTFDATTGNLLRTLHISSFIRLPENEPYITSGFGYTVAISGSTVVVGSPWDSDKWHFYTNTGSAYVFDAATGNLLWVAQTPTHWAYVSFGYSVAVSEITVVVGAPARGEPDRGTAFVFDAATGQRLATLANPTPVARDNFGWAVAVSRGRAVVGEPFDGPVALNHGKAYVFDASLPDLTPPSVVRYTLAEDRETPNDQATANRTPVLTFVFSEPVLGTAADISVSDPTGDPVTPNAVGGWGTDTVLITFSTPLLKTGQYTVTLHGTSHRLPMRRATGSTAAPTTCGTSRSRPTPRASPAPPATTASTFSRAALLTVVVTLDGGSPTTYSYSTSENPMISFDGLGGNDSIMVSGGPGDDAAQSVKPARERSACRAQLHAFRLPFGVHQRPGRRRDLPGRQVVGHPGQ